MLFTSSLPDEKPGRDISPPQPKKKAMRLYQPAARRNRAPGQGGLIKKHTRRRGGGIQTPAHPPAGAAAHTSGFPLYAPLPSGEGPGVGSHHHQPNPPPLRPPSLWGSGRGRGHTKHMTLHLTPNQYALLARVTHRIAHISEQSPNTAALLGLSTAIDRKTLNLTAQKIADQLQENLRQKLEP